MCQHMGHELKRRQGREMELAQGGLPVDWSGQVLNLLTAVPEVVQTLISEANP